MASTHNQIVVTAEMATRGPEPMEIEKLQRIPPPSINDLYKERPNFERAKVLLQRFSCKICSEILLKAQQTPCGKRVCEQCMENKFGDQSTIPCPLSHDDLDEEERESEPCLIKGISRNEIAPDHNVQNVLLKEKCFCKNKEHGCLETVQWRRLLEHQRICDYVPLNCTNKGCYKLVAKKILKAHLSVCDFTLVPCQFCRSHCRRKDLEEHYGECVLAEKECKSCNRSFQKRKQLLMHQRTHPECLTEAGKCYYWDYCNFETEDLEALRHHLKVNTIDHLECLTVKIHDIQHDSNKIEEIHQQSVNDAMRKKVLPLEKVAAKISLEVKMLRVRLSTSETTGDHLLNAMKMVTNSSQQIEAAQERVATIEKQISESGLDRVTVIESMMQNLKRHSDILSDMEKRMRNVEFCSHDGTFIWKIKGYKKRKDDAVRGRQMSIYSQPFYTSRFGYKMCSRAYLNGDGLGRAKSLSLFFVLMKGENDALLHFPFKQRVTFSLLCPSNPSMSKHETFLPDPDSSSFKRPQTEMNIASGCPQFALQGEVESSNFLINDSIFIRVRVEPGGDVVP